jgi:hypothetical protein
MTDFPDRPGYSFDPGPPPEAMRFLKGKGLRPSFGFEDVEPEEHAVAFAVAKVGELDLLEAMKGEVEKALAEGLPFAEFKKSWRANPALTEWWGKKEMTDPLTGEVVQAQLGSPRRLRTIYDANMRSARAAGQWERIERTKDAFPFLEYRLGASEQHRPHHAAKEGLIIAVDSPFWDEWMPPNGWGCKCKVRPVTRREAERRGISPTPDIPDQKVVNKRTGETAIVPLGIDPGWQRNPGKLRRQAVEGLLRDRLEAAPEAVVQAALRDIAQSWQVTRILQGTSPGVAPIAVLPEPLRESVGATARLVQVSSATADKQLREHPEILAEDYVRLVEMIAAASVIPQGDRHLGFVEKTEGDALPWIAIIKATADLSELFLVSFYQASSRRYVARFRARGKPVRD